MVSLTSPRSPPPSRGERTPQVGPSSIEKPSYCIVEGILKRTLKFITDASPQSIGRVTRAHQKPTPHSAMSIRESDIVLAFKAGRAFRREGTNIVEPSPTKGAIYLTNGEDGLLHFFWKDRTTNTIEEVRSTPMHIYIQILP
jgi:hypothetical protein